VSTPNDSPPQSSAEKDALIASLQTRIEELSNLVAELHRLVAAQRDEIARLKGGPGRQGRGPFSDTT
jgi:hypothetical protein